MRASADSATRFREECEQCGLAVTHQRLVIFGALMNSRSHPSPEEVYERVRREIPSISLGTVYKNIKTFVEHGLLNEVSLHHGTARLECNPAPHHHLVCVRCKSITDLPDADLEPVRLRGIPPEGFEISRYSVDIIGICKKCRTHSGAKRGVTARSAQRPAKAARTRPAPEPPGRTLT